MAEYLDFFNIYIMGLIEGGFQFYFLAKILKKKLLYPFYFLFAVCAVIVTRFFSVGTVTGFMVMVFLLTICGILVCHADFKSSIIWETQITTGILGGNHMADMLAKLYNIP